MTFIEFFHHSDGILIVLLTDIDLRQRLHIGLVLRIQSGCRLEIIQGLICLLHGTVILCQEIIDLSRMGIDIQTMTQQVEGCIILTLLSLDHRLHEEMIIQTGLFRGELGHLPTHLCHAYRLCGGRTRPNAYCQTNQQQPDLHCCYDPLLLRGQSSFVYFTPVCP